jgi:hypothetical protein
MNSVAPRVGAPAAEAEEFLVSAVRPMTSAELIDGIMACTPAPWGSRARHGFTEPLAWWGRRGSTPYKSGERVTSPLLPDRRTR